MMKENSKEVSTQNIVISILFGFALPVFANELSNPFSLVSASRNLGRGMESISHPAEAENPPHASVSVRTQTDGLSSAPSVQQTMCGASGNQLGHCLRQET